MAKKNTKSTLIQKDSKEDIEYKIESLQNEIFSIDYKTECIKATLDFLKSERSLRECELMRLTHLAETGIDCNDFDNP